MTKYPEEMRQNIIKHTMKKFVTAKGKDYYRYLGVLEKHLIDDLRQAVADKREESEAGMLSYADLCHLLVMFEFPANRMASLISILEKHRLIKSGIAQRQTQKFGVHATLIELGYEKCPNPDCWRWFVCYCPCEKHE